MLDLVSDADAQEHQLSAESQALREASLSVSTLPYIRQRPTRRAAFTLSYLALWALLWLSMEKHDVSTPLRLSRSAGATAND